MAKQYNQEEKRYNQSKQKSKFPLKLILIIGFILIDIALLLYINREPVLEKLGELKARFVSPKESQSEVPPAIDENTWNDKQELDSLASKKQLDEPITIDDNEDTLSNQVNVQTAKVVENAQPQSVPAQKPKYNIERFVDQKTGKYGLRDIANKKVLASAEFDEIQQFKYNKPIVDYAIVQKGELRGIVDIFGKTLLPFEYTTIYEWKDGYKDYFQLYKRDYSNEAVKENRHHLYGIVKMPEGKITVPVEYTRLDAVQKAYKPTSLLIAEKTSKLCGLISLQNELKLPFEYSAIEQTAYDGYLKLKKGNTKEHNIKYGLLRTSDFKIIVPVEYEELNVIGPISFICAKKDGLTGCINNRNEVIVPFKKVNGTGTSQGMSNDSNNKVYFTYTDGTRAAYNAKGEQVPFE